MYPTTSTAQAASPANPNNNASNILSMGAQQPPAEQYPSGGNNKATDLINQFGNIFQQLQQLAEQFPAAQAEFANVTESLKGWLAKASDSIVSAGG